MIKDKWISYAIRVLKSVHNGNKLIKTISEDIDSPPAYTAKVISDLRKHKLIDNNYDLLKSINDITINDIIKCSNPNFYSDKINNKIYAMILESLNTPISRVW